MRSGMRKPRKLILIHYPARTIELNGYFSAFSGSKASGKLDETEPNEIILKSMSNGWSKQAYVQAFYCETISYKKSVNMFERIEIADTVYEVSVKPSYKKLLDKMITVLVTSGK